MKAKLTQAGAAPAPPARARFGRSRAPLTTGDTPVPPARASPWRVLAHPELKALINATGPHPRALRRSPRCASPPVAERKAALEALGRALDAEGTRTHASSWDKRDELVVDIEFSGLDGYKSYRYRQSLHVAFADNGLMVSDGYGRAERLPLGGLPHLRRLAVAVRERLHTQLKREQKRDKLRKLKEEGHRDPRRGARRAHGLLVRAREHAQQGQARRQARPPERPAPRHPARPLPAGDRGHAPPSSRPCATLYARGARFTVASTVRVGSFRTPKGQA